MKPSDEEIPGDRFEEAWRNWLRRPPHRSPAEAAARVAGLIRERRRRRRAIWAYAAAAVVVAAIGVAIRWAGLSNRTVPVQPAALVQKAPQLGQGEVLMWLDEETPLYMTFQPPEKGEANGGKL